LGEFVRVRVAISSISATRLDVAVVNDDELAGLGEFALLHENAEQIGAAELPPVRRIESGTISALKWGDESPRVVFLHGGGQNAHTRDTVILGLGEPALAVDLPGHGRSAWRGDGDYGPKLNAETLRPVLREWAPNLRLVVGMSLGGLTALRIAATEADLVPELVLVDVTPSAPERHTEMTEAQLGTVALVQGDRTFPSFAAMLDVTVAAAPHRDRNSLRRGVFHNSKQLDDGTWTWRYDSFRKGPLLSGFEGLWDDVPAITMPTTLVRGANSYFVNDEDAEAFAKTAPGFQRTDVVADSGHSVQGDQPRALVDILHGVLDA
jgi:pimeloyl-ACP methyl ester carboxylesterase